ncbi:MAG: hypoxanthine phosphoribosyltransferase [bacterium]|nr:hypoxanthine phosphoribosyltransferase [bacterium]
MKDEVIDLRNTPLISPQSIRSPKYALRDFAGILVLNGEIVLRTNKLAHDIQNDYESKKLVLVGVLDGSVHFIKDLSEGIGIPIKRTFIKVSSYRDNTTSGEIELHLNPMINLNGMDVLIVEDIVDSGKTLQFIIDEIKQKFNPNTVKTCSLLDKAEKRAPGFENVVADYTGFIIPDEFVVGYGLDFADNYRGYRHIAVLKPEVFSK